MAGNIEQLLTALEQMPEIEKHEVGPTNEMLSSILKKNPQYANIIITDAKGTVWASALPMKAALSIKERRVFQQAVKTRRFCSGDFGIGKVSRKPSIGFGYPLIDDKGGIKGVISANIDLAQFLDSHGSGVTDGSSFNLIDGNGVIMARNLSPEKYVGTRLGDSVFRAMREGPERETFIDIDFNGEKKIISYRKVALSGEKAPYLYVRTAFPLQKVLGKARQALLVNIAVLTAGLLLAVLCVIYLGNLLFVKRIEKLEQAARRLAEGDLEARVSETAQGGEIGRLGEVFDQMAAKLAARQAALLRREHDLYELNQNLTKRVEEESERRVKHERLLARHARLVAMGEMIGAIAHQWRQPLATLGATVQSIRMAWERGCLDEAFLQKAEGDAQKQLYYMSDTIEDFRNFFAPDKVAERFEVREKIAEVIMLVAHQFSRSGIGLRSVDRSGGDPLLVRGYQNEFKQSLLNLVSNAFDAIVERRAAQASPIPGDVTIVTSAASDQVIVEVWDDGCGIAPEHVDRVFDPYFTTKSGDKGTGIGLYMTKLIIEESMAGHIGFTTSPEGTRFRVELVREVSGGEVGNG